VASHVALVDINAGIRLSASSCVTVGTQATTKASGWDQPVLAARQLVAIVHLALALVDINAGIRERPSAGVAFRTRVTGKAAFWIQAIEAPSNGVAGVSAILALVDIITSTLQFGDRYETLGTPATGVTTRRGETIFATGQLATLVGPGEAFVDIVATELIGVTLEPLGTTTLIASQRIRALRIVSTGRLFAFVGVATSLDSIALESRSTCAGLRSLGSR